MEEGDSFQIVIKDCPKTTHAFTAILGSWHVSLFAQFFVHPADLWSQSQYYISVTCMPVKILYPCHLVNPDLRLRLFLVFMPKDLCQGPTKTCFIKWKERHYSFKIALAHVFHHQASAILRWTSRLPRAYFLVE